jgi:hypothetical protein
MFFWRQNGAKTRTLKLYSVTAPARQSDLDRALLIEAILAASQEFFGDTPTEFGIHGRQGTPKGENIGVKAFLKKLQGRRQDDSFAVDGESPGSFGFHCLFGAPTDTGHTYSELVFWYRMTDKSADVVALASRLSVAFAADYGFAADFPYDYDVVAESKIRRTLFGVSIGQSEESFQRCMRIGGVLNGEVYSLYRYNFLNDMQTEKLQSIGVTEALKLSGELNLLSFATSDALEHAKSRIADVTKFM